MFVCLTELCHVPNIAKPRIEIILYIAALLSLVKIFQLRQKSLARSIGVTLVTNSVSVPSSPSKDSKAATLGPSSIRNMSRPPLVQASSSTQEFRGRTPLSLPRGASSAAVSLPTTSRHTLQRHIHSTNNLKKVCERERERERERGGGGGERVQFRGMR